MRPVAGYDLSPLPQSRVRIDTGFKPDLDAFAAAGYAAGSDAAPITLLVVPRSKDLARALLAEAAASSDLVLVDGQKTDGIDSLFKEVRKRFGDVPSLTKAHGRLFWLSRTDAFADWTGSGPQQGPEGFWTQAGVFSDGAIDRGSALLAKALPAKLPARIADLGAGWGYLSRAILARDGVKTLELVEAEALALDCAKRNITDPRAHFTWADATRWQPTSKIDGVVMNPPFHIGRAGDPSLGRAFIATAAKALTTSGQLWMVANRHLPYEDALAAHFKEVSEIAGDGGFKVFHASRPKA